MSAKDDLKAKLAQKSAESRARADALLADEYEILKKATRTDLEALRPKITDQALYDQLIALVEEATQKNMDLALLQQRLKTLGSGAIQLSKEVVKLLKA